VKASLYFHVPFCKRKCDYCHFYVIPDKEEYKKEYLAALRLEWESQQKRLAPVSIQTVYFGGGTPYLLGPDAIEEILSWINPPKSVEITLEANPEDVAEDTIRQFASVGINRISLGVQSLEDSLLKALSRQHDSKTAKKAVYAAHRSGVENVSVDLMYELPGQTLRQWKKTLDEALQLPISHVSLYNLVMEPGTAFYKRRASLNPLLPNGATSAQMYRDAVSLNYEAGLVQYEISAFERPGFRSIHNIGYWTGRPFLGFGPSAFSYWEGKRFRNIANFSRYVRQLRDGECQVDFVEELKGVDKLRELLAIRLRMLEGVNLVEFQAAHGILDEKTAQSLHALRSQGLVCVNSNHLNLTDRGVLFYDTVAAEII